MFVRANFLDIYLHGMRDRGMRNGTELGWEIKLTDWSMAQETCLTSPLEYKYRMIFVLILSVICILRSAVG